MSGAALGAGVWWVTHQAATGRSTRSGTGLRTRRTTASEEDWRRGHEVALPWTVAGRYATGLAGVGSGNAAPLGAVQRVPA